jgi:uncharacterized protein (TIGR02145 family)
MRLNWVFAVLTLFGLSCSDQNPPDNPQSFPSVTICNKVWMLKNLDVSTYRNGDPIPKVTNAQDWQNLTTGAYCYYNNDSATYASIYGKLYNWYAVNDPRGLAPAGWHIPTDAEWNKLIKCLDPAADTTTITSVRQSLIAGSKLKEAGTAHWSSPNVATNETGFTALPGGTRYLGSFSSGFGVWWTSTQYSDLIAWDRDMLPGDGAINRRGIASKKNGCSVRCIKD